MEGPRRLSSSDFVQYEIKLRPKVHFVRRRLCPEFESGRFVSPQDGVMKGLSSRRPRHELATDLNLPVLDPPKPLNLP